jgi:hypothetical protein
MAKTNAQIGLADVRRTVAKALWPTFRKCNKRQFMRVGIGQVTGLRVSGRSDTLKFRERPYPLGNTVLAI